MMLQYLGRAAEPKAGPPGIQGVVLAEQVGEASFIETTKDDLNTTKE